MYVYTKIIVIILVLIGATLSLWHFFIQNDEEIDKAVANSSVPVEDVIVRQVRAMSLNEKIGQMLIVGFKGYRPDKHIRKMIKQYHIGGINLLKRNVQNRMQIKELIGNLQELTAIPLIIAVDQEGGEINRITFLNENTPQHAIRNAEQAEQIAGTRAEELRELGVIMNFSPVLDYVSDPSSYLYKRTFGSDPETIGLFGSAMVRGYLRGGIIPVVKHFPGYGNVADDPHTNRATIHLDRGEVETHLLPFKKVTAEHPTVPLMTAHIIIPSVDGKPATHSAVFLSDVVRKNFGFEGVIITDDIEMVSVGDAIGQAAVNAVTAGADIIIATKTPHKQIEVFTHLKNAVLNGTISGERIDKSVRRIPHLKTNGGIILMLVYCTQCH